jgi:hypothetical protein
MCAFKKKTIPEQFADQLAGDIRAGVFGGLLPSVRELGQRYHLNAVSVHKGLGLLVARGVLLKRGPRRRLAIAPPPAGTASRPALAPSLVCRPLVLVGAEPSELHAAIVLALHDLERRCREHGTACVTVDLSGLGAAAQARRIRAAWVEHKPTHVLMICCDQPTYALLAKKPGKFAMIGGSIVARKVARLSADLARLSTVAFDDLRSLGHRRFRLVMLGRPEVPAEQRLLLDYANSLGVHATGVWGGALNFRSLSAVLAAALREGVTAFVFPRLDALVLALAYFDSVGLRVPRDVSVVLLQSGPYDFMQTTQPAHFKFRRQPLVGLMTSWFEFGEVISERFTREVASTYVRGKTVGPVRQGTRARAA